MVTVEKMTLTFISRSRIQIQQRPESGRILKSADNVNDGDQSFSHVPN
jgi:hypothetical protein